VAEERLHFTWFAPQDMEPSLIPTRPKIGSGFLEIDKGQQMKTLGVVIPMKIPWVVCGSDGQLRGWKEQFVAAQILLKGIAARKRFAQLRSR